jgi:hypothetical protein
VQVKLEAVLGDLERLAPGSHPDRTAVFLAGGV